MRIALFAKNKRHTHTTASIASALERAGHVLCVLREGKRRRYTGRLVSRAWTLATVRRFRPDLVLVHAQDVSVPVVARLAEEFPTVMFTPDCWSSPIRPEKLGVAAHVGLLCTVAAGQIDEFHRAGVVRAAYLAEAHDPVLHHPVEVAHPEFASEVAFVGAYARVPHWALRGELIAAVAGRADLKVYGPGWHALGLVATRYDVFPEDYRQICRGAAIVLGRDWREDCRWYFSNRVWFTLGCRGFLLTNYVPGLEDLFGNHEHLVWYRSVGECLELIDHYRARPEERARIAAAGHAYARAHRTYDDFARDLIHLFEGRAPAFPPARSARPA